MSGNIDIRDYNGGVIINSINITCVAMKGYGEDWAVYFSPANNNGSDWLPDRLFFIAGNGQKLPEDAAKQIFPNIGGGPYRA